MTKIKKATQEATQEVPQEQADKATAAFAALEAKGKTGRSKSTICVSKGDEYAEEAFSYLKVGTLVLAAYTKNPQKDKAMLASLLADKVRAGAIGLRENKPKLSKGQQHPDPTEEEIEKFLSDPLRVATMVKSAAADFISEQARKAKAAIFNAKSKEEQLAELKAKQAKFEAEVAREKAELEAMIAELEESED
jgi:hypothetical protein